MRVDTSAWNNTHDTFAPGYWDILRFISNELGDGTGNQTSSTVSDTTKPTAVANYIIILFFLFPVVVMSILCFLRIRVNMLSRRDKGYWGRREYLYRSDAGVHSMASQAPVAQEMSQPLTNGHLSRHASSNSQSSNKSSKSATNKDEDLIKPV